jgi:hypothetical protein
MGKGEGMSGWKRAEEVEPERYDTTVARASLLIALVFVVIFTFLAAAWANYSGILRYSIFAFGVLSVLVLFAYILFKDVARSTLAIPEKKEELRGKGEELSRLIKRAFQGYPTSQRMLEDELREAMMERIRVRRNMSDKAVRELTSTFEGALSITGDKELAELLSRRRKLGGNKKIVIIPSRSYNEKIERIVRKMEEWI